MKLTILTQYYPPETGAPQNRLSDLAKRLAANGHRIEVLTALPNYPGNVVFPEYRGKHGLVEMRDGVRVARVGLYVPKQKSFTRRLANYLSFAWNAMRFGRQLLSPSADVLLWESPPIFLGVAAVFLAHRIGARLVMNVSDLWPQSVVELGLIGNGPALWASRRLEAWLYRKANLITAQTEGIVDDIRGRFPGKPIELFPNGIDVATFARILARDDTRRELGWARDVVVFGYAGVLGHAQALGQVLDAARLLPPSLPVHFAFFGSGPCRDELAARIDREGIRNAAVYSHQPSERMPHIQSAMDVGLVPLARGKVFEGARPSKMFEVMAAGRPVLLCGAGEAARILCGGEAGPAGVAVPAEAPDALAEAVKWLTTNRRAAAEMGERGRKHVFGHFDRRAIAGKLEDRLLALSGRRRAA